MSASTQPTIFISYSHKDEIWKDRLKAHLGVLNEQGLISFWEDRQIRAGEDWHKKIQEAMNAASVAILLISANALTSKFILREEMSRLLQRRGQEGLHIFPVIVKSCLWQQVDWLSRMQVRPLDGKPLASYSGNRRDEALSKIASEVCERFKGVCPTPPLQKAASLDSNRINITRLPITGSNLFGREQELLRLDEAWADQRSHVLSLVAWGGVGKSSLVNHWLARSAQDDYHGAERVYGWSFYIQGTTDRPVSADQFIQAALFRFGDKGPSKGSPWEKGERLAQLVAAQRTLLVLDGLEPLQYPPGPEEGCLKDQALQVFLRQLAAYNKGLCIISTRVPVSDLNPFEGNTVTRLDLETLSPEAGAEVLRAQGVKGTQAELEQVVGEFDGHSLALTLLGNYLSDVYGGDVCRRGEVSNLEEDLKHGRHAQGVMTSYEEWFGEGPELAVLRILGLFNRPADRDAMAALRAAPAIADLTDTLQGLSETNWQRLIAKLRRAKLIAAPNPDQPDTLDAHQLVREHFGQQLKQRCSEAWREGNNRLYEYLKQATQEFPKTLEEMTPLYAAVTYGCRAQRYQDALLEVYLPRISRGSQFYSTRKLGAISANLTALANFFEVAWSRPIHALTEVNRALVAHEAGINLLTLGRLETAIELMRLSLQIYELQQDWENATKETSKIAELYLKLGNFDRALDFAHQCVTLAERSQSAFRRMRSKAILAHILTHLNRLPEAEIYFREAEEIQRCEEPEFPYLSSFWGYWYCDLLLIQGKYQEVQARAAKLFEWSSKAGSLLSQALTHLAVGRADLCQAQSDALHLNDNVALHIEEAVVGLRRSGHYDYLPIGLLAHAELYRLRISYSRAVKDLQEALLISRRGKMQLHQIDCYLAYVQLQLEVGEFAEAQGNLDKAQELIQQTGYERAKLDAGNLRTRLLQKVSE